MEFRRKKFKLEAKEKALQQSAQNNKDFERIIREIKEQQNLEKAKEKAIKVKEERKQLVEDVTNLREEIYYKPAPSQKPEEAIHVGDFVKLKTGGATGTVESISKNKVVVQMALCV